MARGLDSAASLVLIAGAGAAVYYVWRKSKQNPPGTKLPALSTAIELATGAAPPSPAKVGVVNTVTGGIFDTTILQSPGAQKLAASAQNFFDSLFNKIPKDLGIVDKNNW